MNAFSDDLTACAGLVERGDARRFRTVMAAPVAARRILFPLYAFNVEVSRAPWVTAEAMIAEMRLQWWRDALEEIAAGGPVRRHEVVTPLAEILSAEDVALLDALIAARRWDIYRDSFEDQAHFDRYIDETAGNLMCVAARMLGAAQTDAIRAAAWGAGVASFLAAVPGLEDAGRRPLVDGTPDGVRDLAKRALTRLVSARRVKIDRAVLPALWPASGATNVLKAAVANPALVAQGALPEMRGALAMNTLLRRW